MPGAIAIVSRLRTLTFRQSAKVALWSWCAFTVLFAVLMLFFYVAVGPPPQAKVQGVSWFYVRHWMAGVAIFPVYILVFSTAAWAVVRVIGRSSKDAVLHSDGQSGTPGSP